MWWLRRITHRDDRVRGEPLARRRDRPLHEPGPRQAPSVPGERGAGIAERLGLALAGHAPARDLVEVAREHVEAVRVVAEQVGLDQDLRHDRGALRGEAGSAQQPRRELAQHLRFVSLLAQGAPRRKRTLARAAGAVKAG